MGSVPEVSIMESKFILVLLASTTGAPQCLRVAAAMSQRLGQRLRFAHVEIGPRAILLPSQEQLSEYEVEHLVERERAETEKLGKIVSDWTHEHGISAEFDLYKGDQWRVMRHYRRTASMVVLAAPDTQPVGHREGLRAALIRIRHPVVMVPPTWEGGFGRRLLVGWRDVPPLRRALQSFGPFLAAAEQVEAVAVDQESSALDAARAALDPITPAASYRVVASEGRRTATVLLDAATAWQADGLVMGAFRRGEILNWLVPGTSSRLIHSSPVPLLMHP
jgi:nucleotide-binding universal stress UspA family protein